MHNTHSSAFPEVPLQIHLNYKEKALSLSVSGQAGGPGGLYHTATLVGRWLSAGDKHKHPAVKWAQVPVLTLHQKLCDLREDAWPF